MADDVLKALRLAVLNVNNADDLLNGTLLELEIVDCACDPIQGAASVMDLLKEETAAVVGPLSSVVAHFVAHIGKAVQVPVVSYGATDSDLAEMQFPYFFRVIPSDSMQMDAVAALIAVFNWKEVVVIYTDDDFGASGASVLSQSLLKKGRKLLDSSKINSDTDKDEIRSQLTRLDSTQSRVFVLHTQRRLGFRILAEADNLNMISAGYVWIVTDSIASGFGQPGVDPQFMYSLRGLLGTRRHIFSSPAYNNFIAQWKETNATGVQRLNSTGLDPYGLYAYDAVYAVAHAISSHLAQGKNLTFTEFFKMHKRFVGGSDLQRMKVLQNGPELRETLRETTFLGTSGHIDFDDEGDVRNAAFEYVNMMGVNASVVAYWISGSNIVSSSPPHLLDNYTVNTNRTPANATELNITWPGGIHSQIPRGWVLPKDGKPLKIGVPIKAGYTELVEEISNSNNDTKYMGFCIEVFEAARNNLRYAVSYEYIPVKSTVTGKTNPNYDDLIKKIVMGDLDAAIGDITITAGRLKSVDFTQPYIESGLAVLQKRINKKSSNRWAFMRPYTGSMWGTILGCTMFTGVVIWILDRQDNPHFRGTMRKQLAVVVWFMCATFFTAQREETKSFLARIVLVLWLFVVLILTSSYTASLTTILTVEQLTTDIQGLDSLVHSDKPIGYQTGSFVKDYLTGLGVSESRLHDYDSILSYKGALDLGPGRGGVAAIVEELPYVELFLAAHCKDYGTLQQIYTKTGWGFAFPRGSELAEDLSTELLQMSQTGQLSKLHDRWFPRECSGVQTAASVEEQSNQLGIQSFWVLFVIMGTTSVAALLIYLVRRAREAEYFWHSPVLERMKRSMKFPQRRGD